MRRHRTRGAINRSGANTRYRGDYRHFRSSGLVVFVRGDLGITIGTGVSAWADQGVGNDLVQGTAGSQPVFTASVAAIQGRPSVDFDGTDDVLQKTGISVSGAAGRTTFLAMKYNAAFVNGSTAHDGSANQNRLYRVTNSTSMVYGANGGSLEIVGTTFTPQTWSYYTLSANGASSYIKDKLVIKASGDTGTATTLTAITLGTFGDGVSAPASASFAEIAIFSSVLHASAEYRIQRAIAVRYGL